MSYYQKKTFENNIKENTKSISENIDLLNIIDNDIKNLFDVIFNLANKNNFLNLCKEYLDNYFLENKKDIYKTIKFKENDYDNKVKELNNSIINDKKINEDEIKKLKFQNDYLSKTIVELSKNLEELKQKDINKNKDKENEEEKLINSINIHNNIQNNTNINFIPSMKLTEEKKINEKDYFIAQIGTGSFNEFNIDELANSNDDLFSTNENNISAQIVIDTTGVVKEDKKNIIKNKDGINSSINLTSKKLDLNLDHKISENSKEINYNNFFDDSDFDFDNIDNSNEDNLTEGKRRKNNENDICINKNKSAKNQSRIRLDDKDYKNIINNEDIFCGHEEKDFFDFKYVSKNPKVQKLLAKYKEKIVNEEFYSNFINALLMSTKKQTYLLIITFNSFFFLKENFECIARIKANILESIIVSNKNYNLLMLTFLGGYDIIIETYTRMELLEFLQKMIKANRFKRDLNIKTASDFCFHDRQKTNVSMIPTYNNKIFITTPNFENMKKIGILLKYKENIFGSTFQEKLIGLCSCGLLIFNDINRFPKEIIPIINATVKYILIKTNKNIYCFKITTESQEIFMFGSLNKQEIYDWIREIDNLKKIYHY